MLANDDWNYWWYYNFDKYQLITGRHFNNILEVGCGPHTNLKYILSCIKVDVIFLEDPLIREYLSYNYNINKNNLIDFVKNIIKKKKIVNNLQKIFFDFNNRVEICSSPLEALPYVDNLFDVVVCINVLDHVKDFDLCINQIYRVLKSGGLLIIGQDLSNNEDFEKCPESYNDIGHPIKIDENEFEYYFNCKYEKIFKKILSREEGRNPDAHYGTLLGILSKL